MGRTRRWQATLGMVVVVAVLAGCTGDDDEATPASTTTSRVPGATTTTGGSPSTTATIATTVPPSPATTAEPPVTTVPASVPPIVTGLTVTTGAGSGEVDVTWPPLPASADVASYRLTKRKADGTVLPAATVTSATLGAIFPGQLGITDAPDSGPWPSMEYDPGPRCYRVSAVSSGGVEGPPSAEACGSPVGG
jgi:hypothetical protein